MNNAIHTTYLLKPLRKFRKLYDPPSPLKCTMDWDGQENGSPSLTRLCRPPLLKSVSFLLAYFLCCALVSHLAQKRRITLQGLSTLLQEAVHMPKCCKK